MRFEIITSFPEIFQSYFNASILKRAQENGLVQIRTHNPRDFSKDKRRTIDDSPYGGGAGMVLQALPILEAVKSLKLKGKSAKVNIVILSAKGKPFNQKLAYDWSRKYNQLVLISGRYEGIDERVRTITKAEEISIGPYVLTDGDVAAMVVVSAVARLIPGVIKLGSLEEESHWNLLLNGESKMRKGKGLEYPHYTRPEVLKWKGKMYRVPKVLLSGDHGTIKKWRDTHSS